MPTKSQEKQELLLDVLLHSDLELAMGLTRRDVLGDRVQAALEPLLGVFLAFGCAAGLMRRFIADEVSKTRVSEELFRNNSPTTKLMGLLFRSLGHEYAVYVLQPVVAEAVAHPDTPAVDLCQHLLSHRVYGSCEAVPKLLRQLLHDVRCVDQDRARQRRALQRGGQRALARRDAAAEHVTAAASARLDGRLDLDIESPGRIEGRVGVAQPES